MRLVPARVRAPIVGIAWLSEWEWPFEGGYTLMSKFCWANGASATDLCRTVFGRKLLSSDNVGRHGRSLLDLGWVNAGDEQGIPYLRDKAIEGALVSRAARWTHFIGADHTFRYCPACLAYGYQSALHQIEGISSCPIHRQPLHTKCRHCGTATERYAVTEAGLGTPFHCRTCMEPLADSFNPAAWVDRPSRHAAYSHLAPIAQWLQQLAASSLKWDKWDQWHFPLRWHCSEQERRTATFQVLCQVFGAPSGIDASRLAVAPPQVYLGALAKPSEPSVTSVGTPDDKLPERDRVRLYKAVRRYLQRRLRGCGQAGIKHLPSVVEVSAIDGAMQLSTMACPRAQALALWRIHFEAPEPDPHSLVLRPAALYWPDGVAVDDTAWSAYCLASFHAAGHAFNAWLSQAVTLRDADVFGQDRANARALHAKFAPLFAPSVLPTFPAVSSLTFTDASRRARIYVVGPPNVGGAVASKGGEGPCSHCSGGRNTACADTVGREPVAPRAIVAAAMQPGESSINLAYFVPMDQLLLPPALNGSVPSRQVGAWPCMLPARNDLEAISLWLDRCRTARTRATYCLEIEKALVWCVAQRGIALSQMSVDDANAFTHFLSDPTPRDVWLPTHTPSTPRRWSPFRKAPSARTQARTVGILALLFKYWAGAGYIAINPWPTSSGIVRAAQEREAAMPRSPRRDSLLTMGELAYLGAAVHRPGPYLTPKLLLSLAYYGGLKRSEICEICMKDFQRGPSTKPGEALWSIDIRSRSEQARRVYLLPPLVAMLASLVPSDVVEFQAFQAHTPDSYLVDILEPRPRASRSDSAPAPSAEAAEARLKPIFRSAAQMAYQARDPVAAQRLAKASLFWVCDAFEHHLKLMGKNWIDCWLVLGICSSCSPSLTPFLPDRRELPMTQVEDAMARLSVALSDIGFAPNPDEMTS